MNVQWGRDINPYHRPTGRSDLLEWQGLQVVSSPLSSLWTYLDANLDPCQQSRSVTAYLLAKKESSFLCLRFFFKKNLKKQIAYWNDLSEAGMLLTPVIGFASY